MVQQGQSFHYDMNAGVISQFSEPSGTSGASIGTVSVAGDMDDMVMYDATDDSFWLTGYTTPTAPSGSPTSAV